MRKTYINFGTFTIEMWNHFLTALERTNNHVDADNGVMKKACGTADPDMNKAVGQYEVKSRIVYNNAKKISAKKARFLLYDHD